MASLILTLREVEPKRTNVVYNSAMRIDNNEPNRRYKDFWDWLFNYKEHTVYVLILVIGYYIYLHSTTEA